MKIDVVPDPITGRLRALLTRITYKPGVILVVRNAADEARGVAGWFNNPVLCISVKTTDSTGQYPDTAKFVVEHRFQVPGYWLDYGTGAADDEELINWVWTCVRKVEVHEAREFFKLDGQVYSDPHRGDGSQFLYE